MTVQPRYCRIGAAIGVPVLAMLMFRGPLTAAAPGNSLNTSNSMFGCEDSQQLVVKQVAVGNELQEIGHEVRGYSRPRGSVRR